MGAGEGFEPSTLKQCDSPDIAVLPQVELIG